jgi:AcrR family transcriptional regulator
MGLRIEKQRSQRVEIIENTLALAREAGPEAVRVREIRDRCGISDATFFNYFASKDAVLREWADDLVDAAIARAAARYGAGEPLRRAAWSLAAELGALAPADAALLASSLAAAPGSAAAARGPARGRVERADPARAWIEASRARGELRGDVEIELAAGLLRGAVVTALVLGLATPAVRRADLAASLRRALDVVLDGLRKRHERIRPADLRDARSGPVPGGAHG